MIHYHWEFRWPNIVFQDYFSKYYCGCLWLLLHTTPLFWSVLNCRAPNFCNAFLPASTSAGFQLGKSRRDTGRTVKGGREQVGNLPSALLPEPICSFMVPLNKSLIPHPPLDDSGSALPFVCSASKFSCIANLWVRSWSLVFQHNYLYENKFLHWNHSF